MKIQIIDDEAALREILEFNLQSWGYETLCCESAEEALEQLKAGENPDLLLLDVMLPGMSGFKLASILRKELRMDVPIIFLTAKNSENDLLTGFSAGGDDYITKPFSINEVQARVKAVLKRSSESKTEYDKLTIRNLSIDPASKKVYMEGKEVLLSKKEYDILFLLASNPGKSFSRTDVIRELWQDAPYVTDRTVDVHIARIRAKLQDKNLIINRVGFGYSIEK
ncbi:MAG: response regulator transcription factor [Candidatus Cryptobacteroides sp.]